VPLDSCGPYLDVLTATANDKCFGHAVTNTATANCAGTKIGRASWREKWPATPVQPGQPLIFSGTVSNAGNITLTNVLVRHNKPVSNTPVFGPVSLPPGQVTNFTGSSFVPLDSCGPYLDVLTATANDKCFGHAVTNTATANCAGT